MLKAVARGARFDGMLSFIIVRPFNIEFHGVVRILQQINRIAQCTVCDTSNHIIDRSNLFAQHYFACVISHVTPMHLYKKGKTICRDNARCRCRKNLLEMGPQGIGSLKSRTPASSNWEPRLHDGWSLIQNTIWTDEIAAKGQPITVWMPSDSCTGPGRTPLVSLAHSNHQSSSLWGRLCSGPIDFVLTSVRPVLVWFPEFAFTAAAAAATSQRQLASVLQVSDEIGPMLILHATEWLNDAIVRWFYGWNMDCLSF